MATLAADVRFALRILWKNKGFTAIAAFVLALGIVFAAIARFGRKASIGSLVACLAFPVLVACTRPAWEAVATGVLAVLVLGRHAGNIRRLLQGRELSTDGG